MIELPNSYISLNTFIKDTDCNPLDLKEAQMVVKILNS